MLLLYQPKVEFLEHLGKESACRAGDTRDTGSIPELERSPGEGHSNHSRSLPRESCGRRTLAGYSPWGHKESDTTEATEHSTAQRGIEDFDFPLGWPRAKETG